MQIGVMRLPAAVDHPFEQEVSVSRLIQIGKAHSVASLVVIAPLAIAIAIFASALTGFLTVGVSPAAAAQSDCPSSTFCMWANYDYSGTMWTYTNNTGCGTDCWNASNPPGDSFTSVLNNRANKVLLGECAYPYGTYCQVPPPAGQKDCVNPGHGRDLYNYAWPEPAGTSEALNTGSLDLIYSGTTC